MKKQEIQKLLPTVFQRTLPAQGPLSALLEIMESLHVPPEFVLENIDLFFNAYQAPDEFVLYLAHWLDFSSVLEQSVIEQTESNDLAYPSIPAFNLEMSSLRNLIWHGAELSKWQGTSRGLILFLEIATDTSGFNIIQNPIDADGKPQPFHLKIQAPDSTRQYEQLIQQVIQAEKPVYTTYSLEFT